MGEVTDQALSALAAPKLGPNGADRVAASLRALVGVVPFVGPALAEIITEIVPGQRLDRIEAYLRQLAVALEQRREKSPEIVHQMHRPESVDLIEEGAHLAVRALSSARMAYIVHCVASGIEVEHRAKIHHKRVLSILRELDDEEILILEAYAAHDRSKIERLRPAPPKIGSSTPANDDYALYDAAVTKLERLSLIQLHQRMKELEIGGLERQGVIQRHPEKISVPEFDRLGRPGGYRDITPLGRIVLRAIGLQS
jgi:hypothetical protein